jgi:hypothetical protein
MENMLYFEGHGHDGAPFRLHVGEYRLFPRQPGEEYADFKVDNTYFNDGTYSDVYDYGGHRIVDTNGHGSFWNSDFHHNGDLGNYDDPWQNHLGKIYGGLDDLRTTHPRTQDKIIAMTKALISSADIDGIRMDTPMQVPLYFFKRWVPAVKEHARRLGKDNFFIYGEFYCPRERSATMVGRGRTVDQWEQPFSFIDNTYAMDAGINYDFYFKFIGPALKAQTGGVANAMQQFREDFRAYDFWDPVRQTMSYRMLNFFNNHDQYRLNFENDGFQKSRLGSAIIAFWPGIPLYYYGDEQGFSSRGSGIDGDSREDFMTSKAWYDIPSHAAQNVVSNDNFSMTHPDFLYTQKVMNIRKQYNALRNTHEIYERWMQTNNTNGIYAYTRVWGEPKSWVLVAFNTWRDRLEAGGSLGTFYTGWNQGDRIVNVMNPKESYVLGPNGTLPSLKVDGYETKVFVRADNFQSLNPVVNATSIAHDAVIPTGEAEMSLSFSETMNIGSLNGAILVDETPATDVRWDNDHRTVHIKFNVVDGVHKVKVKSQASAQDGKSLWADFQTRFRVGADSNVIVHTQKDPLQDSTLADLNAKDNMIALHHKAAGAQKLRVSLDGGQHYGPWQDYTEETAVPVTQAKQSWDVMVQYWVDGSAAYFVRDAVKR